VQEIQDIATGNLEFGPWQKALLAGEIILVVAIAIVITCLARREWKKATLNFRENNSNINDLPGPNPIEEEQGEQQPLVSPVNDNELSQSEV